MGRLLVIQIIIILFTSFSLLFKLDKKTKKLLLVVDGYLTALFIIVDSLLLLAGLESWLI